jgi:hypothetical protein
MGRDQQDLLRDNSRLESRIAMYVHFHNSYPLCFESKKQYQHWGKLVRGSVRAMYGPCTDCTPEYQERMKQQMRCEHPEVKFDFDEDGLIAGYISFEDRYLAASSNIESSHDRKES